MSSVFTWVTFGLFLVAISSIDITAVPLPGALPPLPSRRYLEPPTPQALENAKKYPRGWGPPPPPTPSEFFDANFFPPNPYKEPPRGLIETNEIPQNNFDGYYPEEEFLVEEEDTSYLDPAYGGDPGYVVEPSQLAYIDSLGNHYQPTRPPYMSSEVDDSLEIENNSEKEINSDEDSDDTLMNNLAQLNAPSQIVLPINKRFPQKGLPVSMEYDSGEAVMDNRLRPRGYNKPTFRPDGKGKPGKDLKTALEEPVVEKKPVQKDLFTRTTTITKTTTWYIDENDDLISKEEIDERPSPIKGKYSKKSKTTTSGPIPWYLQNFEEVIFEEENEKRKTILEKMPLLKGLNPTSITSFTTAPNPWSSEVHEEVVFEEFMSAKDNFEADYRSPKPAVQASTIDQVVEYLPRPKTIFEEIEELEEELLEELAEMLEEEGEVVVEVIIADFPAFAPIPMPQIQFPYPQFPPPMHPLMKPQTAPPQLTTTPQPLQTPQPIAAPPTPEVLEPKVEEEPKVFPETPYPNPNEMINGIAPQVTTPKPLTTMPPLIENNFTQYPPVGPIQSQEQMYPPQPNYNLPQPTQMPQLYANMQTQQPNQNYPGPGGRRDFNGQLQQQNQRQLVEAQKEEQNRYQQRMDAENKMKMVPPGKQRQMYPQQQGMNRQQPRGRDL